LFSTTDNDSQSNSLIGKEKTESDRPLLRVIELGCSTPYSKLWVIIMVILVLSIFEISNFQSIFW